MSDPKRLRRVLLFAVAGGLLAVAIGLSLSPRPKDAQKPAEPVVSLPPKTIPADAVAMSLSAFDEKPVAAFWLDVHDPAKARQALTTNPWIQQVLREPLGQGFVGSWAGFLGTRGEDIQAQFTGTVQDVIADRVLSAPFRLVWFGGSGTAGTPALVLPAATQRVATAFDLLDRVATRSALTSTRCPGEPEPQVDPAKAGETKPAIVISRWTLAEHSVYAAARGSRIVLGRHPVTVIQGLCADIEPMKAAPGLDLELAVAAEPLGREAQLLGQFVGAGKVARFGFGIEGAQLVPRGISGQLDAPGRLGSAAMPESLLKVIPEAMPVMLFAQPKLPRQLDAASLRKHFESKSSEDLIERSIAVLWRPRGRDDAGTEVAVVWSRIEDEEGLGGIFAGGGNRLLLRKVCDQLVFASSTELLDELEATCAGRKPSMLHAAGPVVAGLKAPTSIGVGVHLGKLLSQITLDGYQSSVGQTKGLPAEIDQARQRLEELPFMGLRGLVEKDALVPGGFRS
ncbi:MAG: hypothetical protein ACOX6T_05575 [Myxococcales bacterium]|jgi:hypothetical protein